MRVALRHSQQALPSLPAVTRVQVAGLALDAERHRVTVRGNPVHLTQMEFKLLETVMRSAGRLVTHYTLLHKVWGPEYVGERQLLRVYIGHLRAKIEERPERPTYIITEPGVGYRFCDADEP